MRIVSIVQYFSFLKGKFHLLKISGKYVQKVYICGNINIACSSRQSRHRSYLVHGVYKFIISKLKKILNLISLSEFSSNINVFHYTHWFNSIAVEQTSKGYLRLNIKGLNFHYSRYSVSTLFPIEGKQLY